MYICLLYVCVSIYIRHINKTHVLIKLFCVANCKKTGEQYQYFRNEREGYCCKLFSNRYLSTGN